ncbi:hypothetical protein T4E_636 [Trichinella pseudospiralis]|uniref:Uncharacterized protein n=1 Tax=Trichinella pseudospiralis TaxID=6337 RepID=A0A0V0XE53_TRIPS|nr:hypothetical protein T4E_636 [Trichinella pseudospiralis]
MVPFVLRCMPSVVPISFSMQPCPRFAIPDVNNLKAALWPPYNSTTTGHDSGMGQIPYFKYSLLLFSSLRCHFLPMTHFNESLFFLPCQVAFSACSHAAGLFSHAVFPPNNCAQVFARCARPNIVQVFDHFGCYSSSASVHAC